MNDRAPRGICLQSPNSVLGGLYQANAAAGSPHPQSRRQRDPNGDLIFFLPLVIISAQGYVERWSARAQLLPVFQQASGLSGGILAIRLPGPETEAPEKRQACTWCRALTLLPPGQREVVSGKWTKSDPGMHTWSCASSVFLGQVNWAPQTSPRCFHLTERATEERLGGKRLKLQFSQASTEFIMQYKWKFFSFSKTATFSFKTWFSGRQDMCSTRCPSSLSDLPSYADALF